MIGSSNTKASEEVSLAAAGKCAIRKMIESLWVKGEGNKDYIDSAVICRVLLAVRAHINNLKNGPSRSTVPKKNVIITLPQEARL